MIRGMIFNNRVKNRGFADRRPITIGCRIQKLLPFKAYKRGFGDFSREQAPLGGCAGTV